MYLLASLALLSRHALSSFLVRAAAVALAVAALLSNCLEVRSVVVYKLTVGLYEYSDHVTYTISALALSTMRSNEITLVIWQLFL
jgi:hypothetical protein